MGIVDQLGISASGKFVPEIRITHDLSFPSKESEESINSRVIKDDIEPCMFGYTAFDVLHCKPEIEVS